MKELLARNEKQFVLELKLNSACKWYELCFKGEFKFSIFKILRMKFFRVWWLQSSCTEEEYCLFYWDLYLKKFVEMEVVENNSSRDGN